MDYPITSCKADNHFAGCNCYGEELAAEALEFTRRILAATEPEDCEDGLGDLILGWPYQDTRADMRGALLCGLSQAVADGGLLDQLSR